MLASEVIRQLQMGVSLYGDHPVTVEDGQDPTDPCQVKEVTLSHDRFFSEATGFFECVKNTPHFHIQ